MRIGEPLKTSQVARLLGVSENTIRHWRRHGIGPPCILVGAAYLYDRQAALDWLEQQQDQDSSEPQDQDDD